MTQLTRRSLLGAGLAAAAATTTAAAHAAPAPAAASTERPVRRKDYELTREEALYVIEHTDHAVLATADASGTPYAVPVTPVLIGGKLYFHGTKDEKSRKLLNLRQNARVSLAWVGTSPIKEDEFTVKYVSAVVAGHAREVTDPKEKQRIFEGFTARFAPSQTLEKQREVIAGSIRDAALWEVTIDKVTGKAKAKQPFFGKRAAQTK